MFVAATSLLLWVYENFNANANLGGSERYYQFSAVVNAICRLNIFYSNLPGAEALDDDHV
jgi:hypothetical protein